MMAGAREQNEPGVDAGELERLARQRKRSIAIAVSLGVLVLLFYVATLVKMGSDASLTAPPAATSDKATKQ